MSEPRNTIEKLEDAVGLLDMHAMELRKFSEYRWERGHEAIPYVIQDILDSQIEVNNAVKAMIEDVDEWPPDYLDWADFTYSLWR